MKFTQSDSGVELIGREGKWQPLPVKLVEADESFLTGVEAQLCALAMCLEDTLCCRIDRGFILNGATGEILEVIFDEPLRSIVSDSLAEMRALIKKHHTPKSRPSAKCEKCILKDDCLPQMLSAHTVREYMDEFYKELAADEKTA